ncbi:DUF6468 domain-containing protein [Paracraurococcus ruber]|uniref:DUF6468 domain-containing protein n=1 Tax=Paracraurococcus ruber TaxID=77675 RepID=A0ABS1D287_9PROT|nr:DUF6468 domain-containing protein [Paracraurococcus ruber]MBK1660550.1 hypothetical protein [Paracraurococcus ruber]TDG33246.1 hypothetical protein E2C05_04615 [Paracraurococcus ruber]
MGWIEGLLEIAVMVLLAVALPLVVRLERTLAAVRRDRAVLEGSAGNLTEATRMAEAASIRLRAAAEGGGRQLAERLAVAEPLRDDLRYLVERAESLADRLEALVSAARPLAQDLPPADPPATPAFAPAAEAGRSQAERALLRALGRGR